MREGNGHGEGVGGIVGLGDDWQAQKGADHFLHLGFLGAAVAGDGLLDLHGGEFGNAEAGLGEREQDDATGLADGDGGGDVGGEVKQLDAGMLGTGFGDDLRKLGMQGDQALGHVLTGGGGDDAGINEAVLTAVVIDNAKAGGGGSGVDADNSHGLSVSDTLYLIILYIMVKILPVPDLSNFFRIWSSMRKKMLVVGAAILVLASAGACADLSEVPGTRDGIITYEGRDLLCHVTTLNGGRSYDCNFALFWGDPNSSFSHTDRIDPDDLREHVTPYRDGGEVHCFVYDAGHQHAASTCDYVRWWRETRPSTASPAVPAPESQPTN